MVKVRIRPETSRIFFDIILNARRFKELTQLEDTLANCTKAQKLADKMNAEMRAGTFVFNKYFPNSPRARQFMDAAAVPQQGRAPTPMTAPIIRDVPTFAVFAEQFYREQSVGWRAGTRDWIRSIYDAHLLPRFGALPVSDITRELILEFRVELSEKRTRAGAQSLIELKQACPCDLLW